MVINELCIIKHEIIFFETFFAKPFWKTYFLNDFFLKPFYHPRTNSPHPTLT